MSALREVARDFVLPSAPTRSCQGRDASRVHDGIRLPSLHRRRDRLALGLPAGKAVYEAGIQVSDLAEVLLFSF